MSSETSAVFLDVVDLLCMVESYTFTCSDKLFEPCTWSIPYTIMWDFDAVFNAVLPEGSKVTDIHCCFSALPLTCRDFSGFSESLMEGRTDPNSGFIPWGNVTPVLIVMSVKCSFQVTVEKKRRHLSLQDGLKVQESHAFDALNTSPNKQHVCYWE